jgi:pimeloyl-ACP methyl ester carboxylesterase
VLIGAAGLFVEGAPIGDVFMMAQPERGSSYAGLRTLLFASADGPQALELFPDGMGEIEEELRRYQMLRFGSRVGFKPPYLYNRSLRNRLRRISAPALIITGENDKMVPRAHSETYARLIPGADGVTTIGNAGHSVHVEQPDATARCLLDFLGH